MSAGVTSWYQVTNTFTNTVTNIFTNTVTNIYTNTLLARGDPIEGSATELGAVPKSVREGVHVKVSKRPM